MKKYTRFIVSAIFISGFITSVYAANPASKDYVDQQVQTLQTTDQSLQAQINNIQPGITYTGGTGISITGTQINNTQPGISYTAGTGISITGTTISATTGAAEFTQLTQAPNNSVGSGLAFEFLTDYPLGVYNTTGITTFNAPIQGTAFLLPIGTYVVDYEMSLSSAGPVAISTSPNNLNGSYTVDVSSKAGSSTATTWIHGRAIIQVVAVPLYFIVGPTDAVTASVANTAGAPQYIVRLTILKIA